MAVEQKAKLEQQLWNIANTLRGKMDADDFRDYILGFIFYKYLSTKMDLYANEILQPDGLTFNELEGHQQEADYMEAVKDAALDKLGFFLKPSELFSELAQRGNAGGKREAKLVAADQHGAAAAASKVSVLEWHEGGVGTTGSMNRHLMIVMFAFALMA